MDEVVASVRRSQRQATHEEFERRVETQAARLREAIRAGTFGNQEFSIGLELEGYATDEEGRLARLPGSVFETGACTKELGRHNAELNTEPTAFDADGIATQADAIAERVARVRTVAAEHDREFALDAMWTIPPAEGARAYLSAGEEREGVWFAENIRPNPRYRALDADTLVHGDGVVGIELPGARHDLPSVLVESLATSLQPHLQVPDTSVFPAYYNAAIRTLGPVLALATNAPFLPPDLYEADAIERFGGPAALVEETPHELRVPVFEQSMNVATAGAGKGTREDATEGAGGGKVRVPRDIEHATDVVDRIVADRTCAPFLREWVESGDPESHAEEVWEFEHKRGTYWRWLRAVIGGQPVAGTCDERSLRIEYRPLPTQPSVADTVGLQCLVAGLLRGIVHADHPLTTLDWEAAERAFYAAVADGLEADLAWVSADGERVTDTETIYTEMFDLARRGLRVQGLGETAIEQYLGPIEARWQTGRTPSAWKKGRVREALDAGADLSGAITTMQREYLAASRAGDAFAEWS